MFLNDESDISMSGSFFCVVISLAQIFPHQNTLFTSKNGHPYDPTLGCILRHTITKKKITSRARR